MLKLLKRLLFLTAAILVICLALLMGAAYLAFSEVPTQEVPSFDFSTMRAVSALNSKFSTESGFLLSGTAVSSSRIVTLTKDELNTAFMLYTGGDIIASFFNANREKHHDGLKFNFGSFNNGEFTLSLTQKIPYKLPFGTYLNFSIKAVPEIKDKRLFVDINSFKVGRLKIPALILNFIIKAENNEINSLDEVKVLVNAIKELKTQNDGISIVYYPDKLSEFLSSAFLNSLR